MTKSPFTKKIISLVALVGVFLVSGLVLFQLPSVFGWTNPNQTPPGGGGGITVDPSTGNVGVNFPIVASTTLTVNGVISAAMHNIVDVLSPVAGKDVANKDYVDAQVASAGGAVLTLYGVATSTPSSVAAGNAIYPGQGLQCPFGYGAAVTGFGPHGVVVGGGWVSASMDFQGRRGGVVPPEYMEQYNTDAVAPTYSVCSASRYHIVPSALPLSWTGGDQHNYIIAKACSTATIGGKSQDVCNVCAVCVKGYQGAIAPSGQVPPDTR